VCETVKRNYYNNEEKRMKRRKTSEKIVTIALIIFISNFLVWAYPGGATGYTLKTGTTGCICHGSADNTTKVVINGPSLLAPNQTGSYTVTISNGTGKGVGVDIAASTGTLANSDSFLKVSGSELTQPSKQTTSTGSYVFNFKYTAPATEGMQTLYATGCSSKAQWNFAQNFAVNITNATGVFGGEGGIKSFELYPNYPNPFNPSTQIQYQIPVNAFVTIKVYNVLGNEVETLVNTYKEAGYYTVEFSGAKYSSGIYYYKLTAGNYSATRKMVLLK